MSRVCLWQQLILFQQGVSDKYSWVPGTFSGEGDALLWDSNFQKKAAYTSFLNAISSAPKTTKA